MIINMPTVSMGSDGSLITADRVAYDNDTSGLSAENVQDAIDELTVSKVSGFFDDTKSIVNPFSSEAASWQYFDVTWTATLDCVLTTIGAGIGSSVTFYINGVTIGTVDNTSATSTAWLIIPFNIKKGQTVRLKIAQADGTGYIRNVRAVPIM